MNLPNTDVIVSTKPSPGYQLKVVPIFAFFLVVFPILLAIRLKGEETIYQIAALSVSVAGFAFIVWSLVRDKEVLTWTLSDTKLQCGRQNVSLSISFTEIDFIVIGLPKHSSTSNTILKFTHPRGRHIAAGEQFLRSTALFVRLKDDRIFLLNLLSGPYENGKAVMTEFIKLNASKIKRSTFTYTEREFRKLNRPKYNTIIKLNE